MLLLGLLAFFQITFIPGAIILKSAKIQGTILQYIIHAFALSLITNYCLVFLLTTVRLYNQPTMILILGVEIVSLVWLYNKELQAPVFETVQYHFGNFQKTIGALIAPENNPDLDDRSNLLNTLLTLVLFIFALAGVLWTVRLFISNIGTVFNAWDSVVSWNRWALKWASGQIPLDSYLYPQLIPVNWSTTYVLIGNTVIQTFAKGIMPLFAVFILLLLLDLGLETKSIGFFIGGIFTQLLMKKYLEIEITSGYVDVAVAFFGLLAIYSLIKAYGANAQKNTDQHLVLGAVFSAGAAVTKQPGIYIFFLYPILAYTIMTGHHRLMLGENTKKYLVSFFLAALIPLSWYIFEGSHFVQRVETYEIQEYLDVTANTYGNISIGAQMIAALSRFGNFLLLFVCILAGFLLISSFYRTLAILIIFPYPLIWSWLAGYDMRNLAIFMPIFALTAGISLQELYYLLLKKLKWPSSFRVKNYLLFGGILIVIIVGLLAIPSAKLINQQTQLQKLLFSPSKNEKIYTIIQQDGPGTKILTNYPIRYLPGLENNQVQFGFQNFDTFITWVADPDIQYLFINNRASDTIKSYIDEKISEGDYELVFVDKEWVTYKMIRIINR